MPKPDIELLLKTATRKVQIGPDGQFLFQLHDVLRAVAAQLVGEDKRYEFIGDQLKHYANDIEKAVSGFCIDDFPGGPNT